jgi:acyl carrier protein
VRAKKKGDAMNSTSQMLVHRLLATYLHRDPAALADGDRFDELGLDAFDLVFVVLRLEDLHQRRSDFPVDTLEGVKTVGDFAALVDLWLQEDKSAERAPRNVNPCVLAL